MPGYSDSYGDRIKALRASSEIGLAGSAMEDAPHDRDWLPEDIWQSIPAYMHKSIEKAAARHRLAVQAPASDSLVTVEAVHTIVRMRRDVYAAKQENMDVLADGDRNDFECVQHTIEAFDWLLGELPVLATVPPPIDGDDVAAVCAAWRRETLALGDSRLTEDQMERLYVRASVAAVAQRYAGRPTQDAYDSVCRALHYRTAQLRAHGIEPDPIAPDAPAYPAKDHIFVSAAIGTDVEAAWGEVDRILIGIDNIEYDDRQNGWWETYTGAEFGAKKLAEIKAFVSSVVTNQSKHSGAPKALRLVAYDIAPGFYWIAPTIDVDAPDDGSGFLNHWSNLEQPAYWDGKEWHLIGTEDWQPRMVAEPVVRPASQASAATT